MSHPTWLTQRLHSLKNHFVRLRWSTARAWSNFRLLRDLRELPSWQLRDIGIEPHTVESPDCLDLHRSTATPKAGKERLRSSANKLLRPSSLPSGLQEQVKRSAI